MSLRTLTIGSLAVVCFCVIVFCFGCDADKAVSSTPTVSTVKSAAKTPIDTGTKKVTFVNSDGSKRTIYLLKEGNEYIGPNSERYETIPSPEVLQAEYGF
jgi:hypothetical protein